MCLFHSAVRESQVLLSCRNYYFFALPAPVSIYVLAFHSLEPSVPRISFQSVVGSVMIATRALKYRETETPPASADAGLSIVAD